MFRVAVHCELGELERRELARGDRVIGQARGQFDIVHKGVAYDFKIDTTRLTASDAAERVEEAYRRWTAHLGDSAGLRQAQVERKR